MKVGKFIGGFFALAAATTLALAAGPGASGPAGKSTAVTLERIPGSSAKRVILSPKAAERLGIETGKVSEATIARKQMVAGLIVPPVDSMAQAKQQPAGLFGGFAQPTVAPTAPPLAAKKLPADDEAWVLVTLSPAEWERLAKDKPARVLPLLTRDKFASEVLARPAGMPPLEDAKRSMLNVYYVLVGKDSGLELYKRTRIELPLSGYDGVQKVVPYGAVYYDAKGAPWIYVSTAPLTFERQRVGVSRIEGDLAVLTEGPPVGTPVVTVGAALLYGAEIFGK